MTRVSFREKIVDLQRLREIRDQHRDSRIVLCHGAFDLIHAGHITHFEEAKALGMSMEVAEAVGRLWEVVIRDEGAESDFTAAIKPIEKAAGVVVGGSKGGHAAK